MLCSTESPLQKVKMYDIRCHFNDIQSWEVLNLNSHLLNEKVSIEFYYAPLYIPVHLNTYYIRRWHRFCIFSDFDRGLPSPPGFWFYFDFLWWENFSQKKFFPNKSSESYLIDDSKQFLLNKTFSKSSFFLVFFH